MAKGIGVVYRKAGHRIEGAAGVRAEDAGDVVKAADEGISSLQIFGPGSIEVVGGQVGGGFAEDLGEGWGAQSCLCEFHDGIENGLVAGHECADAAAAGAVAFGNGIHHEHVVFCSAEVDGADMGTAIAKITVSLVGEQVEIVAEYELPEAFHLFAAVEVAGWIIGIADYDRLGARGDKRFEFRNWGEGETSFYIRGQRFHYYARGDGKPVIVGIKRFGDDDFVPGVEAAHEPEEDGFGAAGGDDDLVIVDIDANSLVAGGEFAAVAFVAGTVAVFEDFEIEVADGVEGHFGRFDVGLADVEVVDFYPFFLCSLGIWHEFPDRRSRHLLSAVTDR